MLKRNGEICEHTVPGYPGLLTASEKEAHTEAMVLVRDMLGSLKEAASAMLAVEKRFAELRGQAHKNNVNHVQPDDTLLIANTSWQILGALSKSTRNDLLFCSCETDKGRLFGVIQKLAPNSPYALARGSVEVVLTNSDPSNLLQDYLDGERQMIQDFKQDIGATVDEMLTGKYPGKNLNRVVKAVLAQCEPPAVDEGQKTEPPKFTTNARVRI